MKTRNLLIAALLLGGMTAFNSCSEKEIDNITPPIDQPVAEELDTYLAFTAGFGDKPITRADDLNYRGHEYERIRNYGEFVFEVGSDNKPGKYLASYVNYDIKNPIFPNTDENTDLSDEYGFYLQPLKFKTASEKIAIVVVANCDQLFKESEEPQTFTDFESFSKYANEVTLPLMSNRQFGGYPMSSNVMILSIEPGKYNAVGFGLDQKAGKEELAKALAHYDIVQPADDNVNNVTDNRIYLYRCWSLVKLGKVTVDTYMDGATNARFDLEEAFVMNVPNKTNLFNTETPASWSAWGGQLNVDLEVYLDSEYKFYSGYSTDKTSVESSDDEKYQGSAYTIGFRSAAFAKKTEYFSNYTRSLKTVETIVKQNEGSLIQTELNCAGDKFNIPGTNLAYDNQMDEDNFFTYIVAPSTYGKGDEGQISDQSMVLVLKGKYSQKIGGSWYGIGEDGEIQSSYYTVVINGEGEINTNGLLTPNIENTVMRNVQYEIDMKVKGPGSPTPVAYMTNTYLVPKVTIVPFGKVTQSAERD